MSAISNVSFTTSNKVVAQRLPSLHSAIVSGNKAHITRLLENETNVDIQDHDGQTALHLAVRSGNGALVKLLLNHGANASIQNKDHNTPFDLAKKRSTPNIAYLIQDRQNQHSLTVSTYEAGHLFDSLRLLFTNGVKHWKDADILLFGEFHVRADLTRAFVSRFAPAEKILVCVEGTPSMQPLADQHSIKPMFFDDTNVRHREAMFVGWDAPDHLMPQGNDSILHFDFLSLQRGILNKVEEVCDRLHALYNDLFSTNAVIDKELHSLSIDQLKEFFTQQKQLAKLCRQFVQQSTEDPLAFLKCVQEKNELFMQILSIHYSLKMLYPTCWMTPIGKNKLEALFIELSTIRERLQRLHPSLMQVEMVLSKGCVTAKQIRETFPDRTVAMISTIKSVGRLIAQGVLGRTVLVAGVHHLKTSEKDQGKTAYCLDTLYEELQKHKIAVIVQTG